MTARRPQSRWMLELDPDAPATEAALRVLTNRFAVVTEALALAIEQGEEQPDLLRKLRVATRRSAEAVGAFAPITGSEAPKAARKQLRRLRRVAGDVRACDVFAGALQRRLASTDRKSERAAIEFGIERALRQRSEAQAAFDQFVSKRARRVNKRLDALIREVSIANATGTVADLAHGAFAGFEKTLSELAAQQTLEDPHELRIALKKLKYTLEIFIACAGDRDELLDSYQRLAETQDQLGALNDIEELSAWIGRLARSAPKSEAILKCLGRLAADLDEESARKREAILVWWSEREGRRFVATVAERCGASMACSPADGGEA